MKLAQLFVNACLWVMVLALIGVGFRYALALQWAASVP